MAEQPQRIDKSEAICIGQKGIDATQNSELHQALAAARAHYNELQRAALPGQQCPTWATICGIHFHDLQIHPNMVAKAAFAALQLMPGIDITPTAEDVAEQMKVNRALIFD